MNEFRAQWGKDGQRIRLGMLLWGILLAVTAWIQSPGVIEWMAGHWESGAIRSAFAIFGVTLLVLVIGFLTLAGQLLYADTPLRVEGFWLSRPVGPAAMGVSKVVWILTLAWIVPVVASIPSLFFGNLGWNWGSYWVWTGNIMGILGLSALAVMCLTRNGGELALGLGLLVLVMIVLGMLGFQSQWEMERYVPEGLESSRALIGGGIWLLGALLVIWVQYARRRFALGFSCLAGAGLVVWLVATYWPVNFFSHTLPESVRVGEMKIEPGSFRYSNSSRNGRRFVQFQIDQGFPDAGEEWMVTPIGVESELVTDQGARRYSSPQHTGLSNHVAANYGLVNLANGKMSEPLESLIVFQGGAEGFHRSGERLKALKGRILFRVYRLRPPMKLKASGDAVEWQGQSAFLVDRTQSSPQMLTTSVLWSRNALREQSGFVEELAMLVNPERREWMDPTGYSGGGISGFRKIRLQELRFNAYSRSIDGESWSIPDPKWYAESELWLPVLEEIGVMSREFSIDLAPLQRGSWLVIPGPYDGEIPWLNLEFVDLRTCERSSTGIHLEDRSRWNTWWYADEILLVWSPSNGVKAVEHDENEWRVRPATPEEVAAMEKAREVYGRDGVIP